MWNGVAFYPFDMTTQDLLFLPQRPEPCEITHQISCIFVKYKSSYFLGSQRAGSGLDSKALTSSLRQVSKKGTRLS